MSFLRAKDVSFMYTIMDFTPLSSTDYDILHHHDDTRSPQLPTLTETILRTIELSDAKEQADRFVRLINDHQCLMERSVPSQFDRLHRELQELHQLAKRNLEAYEHLADVWRGAEFNLDCFLRELPAKRDAMLAAAVTNHAEYITREEAHALEQATRQQQAHLALEQAERDRQAERGATSARFLEEELEHYMSLVEQTNESSRVRFQEHVRFITHEPELPTSATLRPTCVTDLVDHITNVHQKQCLLKLILRNEENEMYLVETEENMNRTGRGSDVEASFTILGTVRHGTRETYTVKWYRWRPTLTKSFWCNCPDHKFNSSRKNMVCKHICFLVARVARMLDPAFFTNHVFTRAQHEEFRRALNVNAIHRVSVFPTPSPLHITGRALFLECRKPVEESDVCPICYDSMAGECPNCPTCSNNVHRACMEVWLERNRTCVYCRSGVWEMWR